ncbi:MAG TPA: sugar phosphate nucleotidyltransferase [Ktedonosporobacter sp.]|nr:sugar phosphate nucleotidyltransferase [Ktedonosporobacter sp.]
MEHLNVVILAGGSGTRLWPLSTPSFPKQFLPLPNGKTMIQETLARIAPLVTPEQSWVVTGRQHAELVQNHLPLLPANHILREPLGRNSAPAIAWAAATIASQDPQAIMASFHSDHIIEHTDVLMQALRSGYELAEQGYLVTLGVKPTTPETGYGYIHFADQIKAGYGQQAFQSERFVEKPDLATAQRYLQDGHYVWNTGIFIWKVEAILTEMREHLPEIVRTIERIVKDRGTEDEVCIIDEVWPTLPTISIDHGVMEKTKNLAVIPVDLGWNDVGNWEQYGALFPADEQGVRTVGAHTGLGSQNVTIYNNTARHVFTIGLEDVIVVEMEDMTVICHKDKVQRVKELAEHHQKKRTS